MWNAFNTDALGGVIAQRLVKRLCPACKKRGKTNAKEMEMLKETMDAGVSAHVEVFGEVFPGTIITITDASMVVRESLKYCKFIKQQGAIAVTTL